MKDRRMQIIGVDFTFAWDTNNNEKKNEIQNPQQNFPFLGKVRGGYWVC